MMRSKLKKLLKSHYINVVNRGGADTEILKRRRGALYVSHHSWAKN